MTVKRDPFKDLLLLHERMNRLFDETILRLRSGGGLSAGVWFPPVDIYETANCIVLKAELPGVELGRVAIEVDKNVLTIRGERTQRGLNECNYHRMERPCGTFHRVFSLPNAVNRREIKANLKDGILRITAPKGFEALDPGPGTARIKVE